MHVFRFQVKSTFPFLSPPVTLLSPVWQEQALCPLHAAPCLRPARSHSSPIKAFTLQQGPRCTAAANISHRLRSFVRHTTGLSPSSERSSCVQWGPLDLSYDDGRHLSGGQHKTGDLGPTDAVEQSRSARLHRLPLNCSSSQPYSESLQKVL